RIRGFRSTLTDRTLIQGKLQESIKNEEYEKAAFYRDYLRAMEKTPVTGDDNE
ncbi:MAG: UvrB/UvrC motif-containing protein, partial [Treponema sp.]|nr:UvrB/UvrC motif-containing protein [Treponema sp.]